ncbi:hypothetical protein OROMI_027251 [Orobanche minor]
MGSNAGYQYRYRFSIVHEDEIHSKYKSSPEPGFLFEFRTNFILQTRKSIAEDQILDSEIFDAHVCKNEEEKNIERTVLYSMSCYRLLEYWMTPKEIKSLVNEALSFANQMAAEPEHASLNKVPIVVHLEVYTVQQDGESLADAMDRSIRAHNLVPSYIWPQPTHHKPIMMNVMLRVFLLGLDRIRVEDIDEGLALMPACWICKRKPSIGAQISPLPCKHAFHSQCIVRWLEDKGSRESCPLCDSVEPYF